MIYTKTQLYSWKIVCLLWIGKKLKYRKYYFICDYFLHILTTQGQLSIGHQVECVTLRWKPDIKRHRCPVALISQPPFWLNNQPDHPGTHFSLLLAVSFERGKLLFLVAHLKKSTAGNTLVLHERSTSRAVTPWCPVGWISPQPCHGFPGAPVGLCCPSGQHFSVGGLGLSSMGPTLLLGAILTAKQGGWLQRRG